MDNLRKTSKAFRLNGAGRHLLNDDIDAELAAWVKSEREKKLRISRRMIQARALELFKKKEAGSSAETFQASIGWLQKFLIRHNFRLRRPTTVCQKPPDQYEKILTLLVIRKKFLSLLYSC